MLLTPSSSSQDFSKLEKKPAPSSTSPSSPPVIKHKKSFFSSFGRSNRSNHSTPPTSPSPSKLPTKSNNSKEFSSSFSSSWAPSAPSDEFTSPYQPFSLSPVGSNFPSSVDFPSSVGGGEEGASSRRGSISKLLIEQGMIDSEWISLDPFDQGFSTGLPSLERNINGENKIQAVNSSKNSFFYPSPISPSNTSLPPTIDRLHSSEILKTLPSRRDSLQSPVSFAGAPSTVTILHQYNSSTFTPSPSTNSAISNVSPETPTKSPSPSSRQVSPLYSTIPSTYNSDSQVSLGIAEGSESYSPLHAFYGSSSISSTKVPGATSSISTPSILTRSTLTLDLVNLNRHDSSEVFPSTRSTTSSNSITSQDLFDSPLPTTPTKLSNDQKKTWSIGSGRSSIKKVKDLKANRSCSRSSTPLPSIQSFPEFGDTFGEDLFVAPTTETLTTTTTTTITTDVPEPTENVPQEEITNFDQFTRSKRESNSSVNESRRESEASTTTSSSSYYASVATHQSIRRRSSLATGSEDEEELENDKITRRHSVALSRKLDLDLVAQEESSRLSLLAKNQASSPKQIETLVESPQEENLPPIIQEPSPRFEFALVIFPSTILVSLLTFLPYKDFESLMTVSKTLRSSFHSEESKELILQRYLGSTVGYKSLKFSENGKLSGLGGFWSSSSSDMAQSISSSSNNHSQTLSPPSTTSSALQSSPLSLPLRLTLQDLQAFKVGQKYSLQTYAKLSAQHILNPLSIREVKRIRASTRAWSRVLLRLREQYELVHGESIASNGSWREINVFKDLGIIAAGGRTPIYKAGRAIILRVWVPLTSSTSTPTTESTPSNWMSDIDVENCETEMRYCYPPGHEKVLRGDVVSNVSMGDFGNEGKLLFDGRYLRDFCFEYDSLGHLPQWLDSLAFSPGYYHNVIYSSHSNPVFFITLKPFIAQIRENLALHTENVRMKTLHSDYNVKKFIYRSNLTIKPNAMIGSIGGAFGSGPGGILMAHEGWQGTVVLEAEGTTEAAVELIKRCEREEGGAWRVVREKSRVGRIWLKLVGEDERVR